MILLRTILIAVLTIGIAGTAFWGYQEHQEKNAILINSENNYQRAFHSLTYQMDDLHNKIGTTLAMNSRKSLSPALVDVWRITSEAKSEVGQLPLTLLPFNKTEEFLSNIGDFSYRTAVRDLDKDPLSPDEYSMLKKLYSQSSEIRNELRKVQHLILKNNLRWMDVEMALVSGNEASDNTIIDGFKTVEKTATGYDEENVQDPSIASFQKKNENFDHLTGKTITEKEAVKLAGKIALIKPKETLVTENGEGAAYGFYSVNLDDGQGQGASMDITKKGGYPIWFINHRDIGEQKISLNEAQAKAEEFLKANDYKDLALVESLQYNSTGLLTYATEHDGVVIYPESIKLKVALDNGQIVGFSADDYLKGGKDDRTLDKPVISKKDAREYMNANVNIMEDRLAVITNDIGEEVLCYELIGTMDQDTYRVYINAKDGTEEKVEKLQNAEPVYENML